MNVPAELARAHDPVPAPAGDAPPARLTSLDAFRGFVMFLMAAEVLRIGGVAEHFPTNAVSQSG